MIRELSTLVIVGIGLVFTIYIIMPPLFHAYNWMANNNQFPSNTAFTNIRNFADFIYNNFWILIILLSIITALVYVSTRGSIDI